MDKPHAIEPKRVQVFEALSSALMITSYPAKRPDEVGHVGFVPYGQFANTRPGGSAMR